MWSVVTLRQLGIAREQISWVIVAAREDGEDEILSLVGVDQAQLRLHLELRRQLSELEYGVIREAWEAWSSEDPRALWRFCERTIDGPHNLPDRVRRLKFRYPAADTGLNQIDKKLLELSATSIPRAAATVVTEYMTRDPADPDVVGDVILLRRLMRLADSRLARPLLEIEGDSAEPLKTRVRLTHTGRDVLEGRANQVDLNGIDEWIGGVHLMAPPGPVWYIHDGVLHLR